MYLNDVLLHVDLSVSSTNSSHAAKKVVQQKGAMHEKGQSSEAYQDSRQRRMFSKTNAAAYVIVDHVAGKGHFWRVLTGVDYHWCG